MRTLLIPIDFSNTSANVLRYAGGFITEAAVERIILLKSNYVSIYAQLLPSADFVQLSADDIVNERTKTEKKLKTIAAKLQQETNATVETFTSEQPLLRAIHEIIAEEGPDLLLTGIDDLSRSTSLIGELAISIAKTSAIPVLLIPAGAKYRSIEQALVPCDFSAVSRLKLLKGLSSAHQWLKPSLLILNVDPEQTHFSHETEHLDAINDILTSYDYSIHYSEDPDTVHGILSFSDQHAVQLIIALPGRYSFFYNLTHRSITDALALNADQPVLILK